jgi:hypothetical protein
VVAAGRDRVERLKVSPAATAGTESRAGSRRARMGGPLAGPPARRRASAIPRCPLMASPSTRRSPDGGSRGADLSLKTPPSSGRSTAPSRASRGQAGEDEGTRSIAWPAKTGRRDPTAPVDRTVLGSKVFRWRLADPARLGAGGDGASCPQLGACRPAGKDGKALPPDPSCPSWRATASAGCPMEVPSRRPPRPSRADRRTHRPGEGLGDLVAHLMRRGALATGRTALDSELVAMGRHQAPALRKRCAPAGLALRAKVA